MLSRISACSIWIPHLVRLVSNYYHEDALQTIDSLRLVQALQLRSGMVLNMLEERLFMGETGSRESLVRSVLLSAKYTFEKGRGCGGYVFLNQFAQSLQDERISVVYNQKENWDVALWVHGSNSTVLLDMLSRGSKKKIALRIDGLGRCMSQTRAAELRHAWSSSDLAIFQSRFAREKLRSLKPDVPSCVIYNGVNTEFWAPSSEREPTEKLFCLFAAWDGLVRRKAFPVAVRVIRDFEKATQKLGEFVIAGMFPRDVRRRVREAIPKCRFVGRIERQQLRDEMRRCQVFVFPSEFDYCPNVLLEAMSTGQSVVYSPTGASVELVGRDGDCGRSISHGVKAIADAWERWEQYGYNARLRVERFFSWTDCFQRYMNVLNHLAFGQEFA